MEKRAYHIIVRGKVQGVFYRKSTQRMAVSLGLNGWVRNNEDGSVEMEVEGSVSSISELINWCTQGPKNAVVSSVDSTEIGLKNFDGFRII